MRYTEEQGHRDLRDSLRSFLADHASSERVRRIVDGPQSLDRDLWGRLCTEHQVVGMCLPAEYGGAGAPFSYQSVVLEELGRTLAPVPYLSTAVLAASAFVVAEDDRWCRSWLPRLAAGEVVATVATMEDPHDWELSRIEVAAEADGDQWRVTGTKRWVVDGPAADLAVVLVATVHGPTAVLVELDAEGVERRATPALDPTRPMADLRFDRARAHALGRPGDGLSLLRAVQVRARVALAAEQLGGAQRALEMAVDHGRGRVQFGRAIGSFQAIKHRLADRFVATEALTAAVRHAGVTLDEQPWHSAEAELVSRLCQAEGSEVFLDVAGECIQVHGGIGYTWEHDAHLYFKRATASRQWLGTPEHQRERVAAAMLDGRPEEDPWNR